MTAIETPDTAGPVEDAVPSLHPRYREIGMLVASRAKRLQESRHRPATVATLARLRGNVAAPPGTDPALWAWTVDGVPGVAHGDEATREERAVHAALTLYALHQQSRDSAMHRPGIGLGLAVARLDRAKGGPDDGGRSPVRRRFDAVVTAATMPELTHHLRGLVAQLRGEDVGLDYGMLADDLDQFQRPGGADVVRRRWARQFYRLDRDQEAAADGDTDPAATAADTPEEHQ